MRTDAEPPGTRRSIAARPELWLVLLVLVVFGPFVQELTAQPASRYALTAAIWERHTVDIDGYQLGVDVVVLPNGRLRSDKAPGQPLLAVPVFAVGRVLGVESATHRRVDRNLGLWWVTLWSTVLPLCLLAALIYRASRSLGARAPMLATLAIVFATTIGAFASQLYGHVLAATFAFAAWYILREASPTRLVSWLVGGLLVTSAIVTEYQTVLIAIVLSIFVLRKAPRRFGWYLAGGAPPAIVAAVYNQIAFGSPWKVSYGEKGVKRGLFGVGVPSASSLVRIFFADRGLLILTPVVIVAVVFAIALAIRPGSARVDAVVALACFGSMLALQASWANPWGGEAPGPRYLIPALPFLAAPLAFGWSRRPRYATAAAVWGGICMSCAVITRSAVINLHLSPLSWWSDQIRAGKLTPTIWSMAAGPLGWALHVATIAGVIAGLMWSLRIGSRRVSTVS